MPKPLNTPNVEAIRVRQYAARIISGAAMNAKIAGKKELAATLGAMAELIEAIEIRETTESEKRPPIDLSIATALGQKSETKPRPEDQFSMGDPHPCDVSRANRSLDKKSETPRTDAVVAAFASMPGRELLEMVAHARQLEREIHNANVSSYVEGLELRYKLACDGRRLAEQRAQKAEAALSATKPIDMLLFCPRCGLQHVDEPEPEKGWTNSPHATHTCKGCGLNWRPSNDLTNGVGSLTVREEKHRERMQASDPLLYRSRP